MLRVRPPRVEAGIALILRISVPVADVAGAPHLPSARPPSLHAFRPGDRAGIGGIADLDRNSRARPLTLDAPLR